MNNTTPSQSSSTLMPSSSSSSSRGNGSDPVTMASSSGSIPAGSSLLGLSTPDRPSQHRPLRHKASMLSVRSHDGRASPAPSTYSALEGSMLDDDPDAIEDLEESMRHSGTIDEFTRIITEFRQERRRRGGRDSSGSGGSIHRRGREASISNGLPPSSSSRSTTPTPPGAGGGSGLLPPARNRDSFDSTISDVDPYKRRCTCCCGQESCERAKRATTEWADMESDLRLAAEIGQALLRKHDDLAASVSSTEARHSSQVDALMSKLTRSIKESKDYEKRLAATSLNLEAADSSNRALLAELDDCRKELSRVKAEKAKMSSSEGKAARLARELEDAQQEVAAERKRTAAAEARAKRASERAAQLTESLKKTVDEGKVARQSERARLSDDIVEAAKERFRASMAAAHPEGDAADASSSSAAVDASALAAIASQNEALERQVDQTSALLEAANEELAALREERANWTATTNASSGRGSIPFLGRSAHTRSASGISDAHRDTKRSSVTLQQHHLQHLQDAAQQSSGNGNEDPSSAAAAGQPSPSLADELVSHEMVAQPSRSPSGRPLSLSLHRPLLLSDRSNSRASARSDASSPRLGGQTRLLSPTMPYFDPSAAASAANASTTATAGGSASPSTTVDSTATIPASAGRRSVSSDAQKIRAAYIAQQQLQQQSAPSESGSTSDTTSLSLATSTSTAPTSHAVGIAGPSRVPSSSMPPPPASAAPKRDPRTAHLLTLLDYVQRLYSRLSTADVDTLARRLQRQHLAGDVGHLAKVTINGITRDAEGLREHFRRLIEQEARANAAAAAAGQPATTSDAASSRSSEAASGSATASSTPESLLTRKDFFTLVKLLRDVLSELARLRSCINEVQLAPHQAAKILNEHLHGGAAGVAKGQEDKGVGGWFGRILAGGLAVAGGGGGGGGAGGGQPVAAAHATPPNHPPGATLSPQMGVTNVLTGAAAEGGEGNASPGGGHPQVPSGGISRPPSRGPSSSSGSVPTVPQLHRAASRGSAAASRPSTVAVEVKGGTRLTSAEFAAPQGERASPSEPPAAPAGGLLRAGPRATRGRASLGVPGSGGAPHPHLLSRVQSRNLSGLFAGAPADAWESLRSTSGGPGANGDARLSTTSATAAAPPNAAAGPYGRNRPLSRIVDDDEVSLHHGKPAWAGSSSDVEEDGQEGAGGEAPGGEPRLLRRRARGLSDSSIHSTFLEDAAARQEANARQGHGLGISNAAGAGAGAGAAAGGGGGAPATRIMSRATLALQAPIALRGAGGGSVGPATVTRAYGSSRQYGEEDDEDGDTASTLSVKASAPSSSSGGESAAPTSSSRSGRPSTAGGSSSSSGGGLLAGFGQSVWSNLPSLRPQPSSATLNTSAAASAAALLSSSPGAGGGGGGGGVGRPGAGAAGGMGPAGGWGAI